MKLTGCSQMTSSCYCSALLSSFLFHPRSVPCRIYFAGILSPEVKINVYFMSLEAGTKSAFSRLIFLCIFHCCCLSCFNRQRVPANIANFNAKLKLVKLAKPSKQLNLNVCLIPLTLSFTGLCYRGSEGTCTKTRGCYE